MGENVSWWIWSLVYFHSFEALNDAFEVQFFSGVHFYTLSKALMYAAQIFKSENIVKQCL